MVSVVMSVFNEESSWLRQSIDSVLNQTYRDIELIIVLDNPDNRNLQDILMNYAKSDKRIRLQINKKNMGLAKSLNIGMDISKGEFIARMDADDVAHCDRLKIQMDYMINHPELDMIAGRARYIDEDNNLLSRNNWLPTDIKSIKRIMAVTNVFIHPTLFFRRNILMQLKGYNDINPAQDYEFISRAIMSGYHATIMNDIVLDYRIRKNSISNKNTFNQMVNASYIRYLYKHKKCFDVNEFEIYKERLKQKEIKYELAQYYYTHSIINKDAGGTLKFIYYLVKSVMLSRLWRHRLYEGCVLNIVQMVERYIENNR